jgi:hypothetical protein
MNLVTPIVVAKSELLFNKPTYKVSSLTPQIMAKFIAESVKNLVTPKAGAKKELFPQNAPI